MRHKSKCKNHSGVLHLFTNLFGTKYGGEQDRFFTFLAASLSSGVWGLGLSSKSPSALAELRTQVLSAMVQYRHKRGHSAYKCVIKGRRTNVKWEHSNLLQCSYLLRSMSSFHSLGGTHEKPWNSPLSYLCHATPPGPYPPLDLTQAILYSLLEARKRIFCKN